MTLTEKAQLYVSLVRLSVEVKEEEGRPSNYQNEYDTAAIAILSAARRAGNYNILMVLVSQIGGY